MFVGRKEFAFLFQTVAETWLAHKDELSEIDSRFGDGDHGITISKIAKCILEAQDNWQEESIRQWIEALSFAVVNVGGGSAGPLYGTLIEGLALPLDEETAVIDPALMRKMIKGSKEMLFEITKARAGDKTMMDALIPAAGVQEETDMLTLLECMAVSAREGSEATKQMTAKFGRARSYGEQTIGTPDAGAVSTALFFEGLYQGAKRIAENQ